MSDNNKNIIPEENNGNELVRRIAEQKYEFGFTTDVHTEIIEKGLNENVVRLISCWSHPNNRSLIRWAR